MTAALLALILGIADDPPAAMPLPEAWHGTYVGTFVIEGESAVPPFRGELRIAPIEGGPRVTWTLIYGEGEARQVRPYELAPEPGAPGRFVIDERNGVTIDLRLVGEDLLLGQFEVAGNLITARYERVGDAIRCELATFPLGGSRTMAVEGSGLVVTSAPLRSLQRAELTRQAPGGGPPR